MTGERGLSEERLAERLTEALEKEANAIQVRDGWEAIASRLVSSSTPAPRLSPISGGGRRRRAVGAAGIFVGVAAALLLAVVLGWRPFTTTLQPAAPPRRVFLGTIRRSRHWWCTDPTSR